MAKKDTQKAYNIVIGFLAVIISLSEFKDELKEMTFLLFNIEYSLAQYLFTVIIILLVSLYFYSIDHVISYYGVKSLSLRIIARACTHIAYFLFSFIIISPIFLLFLYLMSWSYESATNFISGALLFVTSITSIIGSITLYQYKKEKNGEDPLE